MTKGQSVAALAVAMALVALAGPAHAVPICDTTFVGNTDDSWHAAASWDNFVPTSTKVACVNAGDTVMVYSGKCNVLSDNSGAWCEKDSNCTGLGAACDYTQVGDAAAKAVYIKSSGTSYGIIHMGINGGALTLHGGTNSQIDGILQYADNFGGDEDKPMLLKLAGNVTIDGNGGFITGNAYPPSAEINSSGGAYTLTLVGSNNSAQSTSLTLNNAWEVNVGLDNDGWVVADYDELRLNQTPVSGDGVWAASKGLLDPGVLEVNVAVTGSARWQILSYFDTLKVAKIQFNADCPSLTGDFTLEKGTLEITANVDVVTTGNLSLKKTTSPTPTIQVASTASIEFGAAP